MRTLLTLGSGLCLMAGLSFGVTMYRGQLMDASCYNQNQSVTGQKAWVRCVATPSTTNFAIHTRGRIRMLDNQGDYKAEAAFQDGLLRVDKRGDIPVTIDGRRHGNTIRVEGIEARGSNTSVH